MNVRPVWVTAAVLAIVAVLAQVAGAASRSADVSAATSQAITASVSSDLAGPATTLTLPSQASSTAVEKSANGLETANTARAGREAGAQTQVSANAQQTSSAANPADGTAGARAGWGCGDTKHTHTGPPGRPNATPPPGCARP
jgi:hypothetical protein